jgi:hypothetical protein
MTDNYPPRMRGLVDRLERAARIAAHVPRGHIRYAKVQADLAAAREAVLRAMTL